MLMSELEILRESLIKNGFRREFIEERNAYFIYSLYEVWGVEDPDEQLYNVLEFLEEYGFSEEEAFQ